MSTATVQQIQDAIGSLSAPEREDLFGWLDSNCLPEIDARLASGLEAGLLDNAILRALDEEKIGQAQAI
jgi:hypothetical protein